MDDRELIKTAAEAEATEKQAVQPMGGPMAGGGAPMPMDPAMMGGMPPIPPVGGDPAAAGGAPPPFDPAMLGMGGPPPGGEGGAPPPFDPSMLGPPPGEAPPGEEPPPEEPVNDPERDMNEDGRADTMVPLNEMKDFTVGIIEATKGKKTQEAAPPGMEGAGAGGAEPQTPPGAGPLASIGAAPSAEPMGAMPKLSDIQAQMEEDLG